MVAMRAPTLTDITASTIATPAISRMSRAARAKIALAIEGARRKRMRHEQGRCRYGSGFQPPRASRRPLQLPHIKNPRYRLDRARDLRRDLEAARELDLDLAPALV